VPSSRHPNVHTIPPHRSFADALAAGLIAQYGRDKTGLARGLLLVPNNRAARAITDAFVRRSEGGLLLPRLVPIGDEELDNRIGSALEPLGEGEPIAPAVDPIERLLALAGLVQRHLPGIDAAEALRLGEDLARTLDQLIVEQLEPRKLRDIAADLPNLSLHWQHSLDRLRLILDDWPDLLRRKGRIDLADRRNRILSAIARRWRDNPPDGFVVAGGITMTAPAVARLLRTIAMLERGTVVLPALDIAMPEEEWQALGPHQSKTTGVRARSIETHPQFHLKLLLDRMGIARGEVEVWRWGGGHDAPEPRSRAIQHAMAPAGFTDKWEKLPAAERRFGGVRVLELADSAQEAQAVAIAMREALEQPARTVALVTPDRALAARVSAHLKRWDIEADDSAGRPLSNMPPGTFLIALATAAAERFAPVPLLALLKHPLVQRGEGRLAWLDGVRLLDLALRGPRPRAGLAGIAEHLADREGRDRAVRASAERWWREAAGLLQPLEQAFQAGWGPGPLLAALREAATRLAGDELWAGSAGRAAAELFEALEAAAAEGPAEVAAASLPAMLEQLMRSVAIRPPYGQHPRVFIWGLIEARLQQADLVILGGLNEGTWPALPQPDPWLAPRIRHELGLPGLERRIGLAAHDFAMALGAPNVIVTRARRDAKGPAVASRFWLRLEALSGGLDTAEEHRGWARLIDQPPGSPRPAARPAPAPDVRLRPRRIAVTDLDRLKADPFAFYARTMLKLASLDAVDADPSAAWRGSAVHAILEAWMKQDDCDPAHLRPRAEALLAQTSAHPLLRALWQPRLLEAIDWIAEEVARHREQGRLPLVAEARGACSVAAIELYGIADRIDRCADGTLAIVDYKTGRAPSTRAVAEGFAMQLGLLGLIAERGGFEGVSGTPAAFEYWSLARERGKLGYVQTPTGGRNGLDPAEFTRLAASSFIAAAEMWLTGSGPFTAKLHPDYAPYGEYDQLMRLDEWYGREGSDQATGS
jgi:ATP-dependent helicase/nuclease subunit B